MKRFVRTLCLILTSVLALYVLSASWLRIDLATALKRKTKEESKSKPITVYDIEFANEEALNRYMRLEETRAYCGWILELPSQIAYLIGSLAGGYLGGVTGIAFSVIRKAPVNMGAYLALSSLLGLLLLASSYAIPSALTAAEVTVRPTPLLFLCVICGVFAEHILLWIKDKIEKIFERKQ